MTFSPLVVWHDIECGRYDADLPLWRELAAAAGGPVLDVGAGTGRVALDLARAGHDVTAFDVEPALLGALDERTRAEGLAVATIVGDACALSLGRRFALILVPMQTIQLLSDRAAFLAAAHAHLEPGGLLAISITAALDAFSAIDGALPDADEGSIDAWRFASQPTAVRALAASTRIERVRRTFAPDGTVTEEEDAVELAHLEVDVLEAEGSAAGLEPLPTRHVPATREHVGSEVVLLRA
jgi:SAM-dependent methyltransferase